MNRRNMIGCFLAVAGLSMAAFAFAAEEKKASTPQDRVDAIVKSYLAVQQLLAKDKFEGVTDELGKIRSAATALSESNDAKVKEQAKAIEKHSDVKVKDIKAARELFKPLSTDVIALAQLMPPAAGVVPELYEATCPMAKANWLQASKDITNPYMGKEMLDCGEIQKKIAPAEKK
jgi:hypothetical protein